MRSIFFEENAFQIVFQIFGGNVSGSQQTLSSTVVRTALIFRFFNRIYAIFLRILRKSLLAALSELHFSCPQDCFHRKQLQWKKNTFQIVFHNLDGKFSGLWQKFSSTVVRTALVSRFFNRTQVICFGFYAKIFWLICHNCTLHVHRIVFIGSNFNEKNTLFKLYFTFWVENFQVYGKFFPARLSELHWFLGFLIGLKSFVSDFTKIFFDWSVITALYVSTGLFSSEATSLKKTLFILYFTFWVDFYKFLAKFFQHGRQNCIGF